MLVSLIITSLNHLSGMRLVLFLRGIGHESNIVVNIEVEERTRFSTGFVDDEVIKRMVLDSRTSQMHGTPSNLRQTYMRYNEIFLCYGVHLSDHC